MKIMAKVTRYIELSDATVLDASEQKERTKLHRTLTACGLSPKHQRGLKERAIVFDNKSLVQAYIKAAERAKHIKKLSRRSRRSLGKMTWQLYDLGIENVNCRSLQTIMNELKQNAKAADQLKRKRMTRPPHRSAQPEEIYYDGADEFNEEDDVDAVPAEATAF